MALSAECILSRFKGTILGALVGDCLGAPFEADRVVSLTLLNNYIKKLENPKTRVPFKAYTDDFAMTKCVAQSFIDKKSFDHTDMAKKFVNEYYKEPKRGYGANIVNVFAALKATKYNDVFAPAALQFDGLGSYGNGGGMRVSPVALYSFHKSEQEACDTARQTALLTHSNSLGYNGAILQCLAVRKALHASPNSIEPLKFVDGLIQAFKSLPNPREEAQEICKDEGSYVDKLLIVKELLCQPSVDVDEVVERLGNNISAPGSIPTAIYVFLKAFQPISGIQSESHFLRTVMYAISLGGDTDTIASMAGAIAGAHLGHSSVPDFLAEHCEGWKHALELGDQLFLLTQAQQHNSAG